MHYPISMIPYSNMEPFRQLGPPKCCRFVPLVPKKSIEAIRLGYVHAAAIPVGGLSHVSDLVETIGHFGIAAKNSSMSVLFFSKIPFSSICKNHKIQLTTESESSVKLLYLLLGYKNGFNNIPKLSPESTSVDGKLIIGDKALLRYKVINISKNIIALDRKDNWPYVTDLAQLWYEVKGYPFVFARWVIRKDVPAILKKYIEEWLSSFKDQEEKLVKKAIKTSSEILGVNERKMRLYFKVIRRTLDASDLFGQKLFITSFEKNKKDPLFSY